MSLGRFGGVARSPMPVRQSGEDAAGGGNTDLMTAARQQLLPSSEGQPAASQQLRPTTASMGINLIRNGGVESWSAGSSAVPDGWTSAGAGATVAKNTTNVQEALASCDLSAALNTATSLSQTLTISGTQNTLLRSSPVTFSAYVKASVATRAFLRIEDGVNTFDSPYHSGGGTFELLTVTAILDSAATQVKVSFQISSGAVMTATIDAAILTQGASVVAFSPHPNDILLFIANYQNSTPANKTDIGVWRSEIGVASLAGITTADTVSKTITLQTALRSGTVLLTGPSTNVGAVRTAWRASAFDGSTFSLTAFTSTGVNFTDTSSGLCFWCAIGPPA